MTIFNPPPDVALTAPGLCRHLTVIGRPHAGDACLVNGRPSVPLYLGRLDGATEDIELDVTSLAELDHLEAEVRVARARLAQFPVPGSDAAGGLSFASSPASSPAPRRR